MGRTQPSFTVLVDGEVQKLIRVAERIRNPGIRDEIIRALSHVREIQEAMYDELTDPQEVVMLTLLLYLKCGNPGPLDPERGVHG